MSLIGSPPLPLGSWEALSTHPDGPHLRDGRDWATTAFFDGCYGQARSAIRLAARRPGS